VNKTKAYNPNGPNGPSYSAYISYSSYQDASVAILAIDNIEVDDHLLRASYGTTKYCTFFLKNLDCPNKDCLYLHYLADDSDIINRDDMNSNTNIFYEQQLLAMKLADVFNADVKKKLKVAAKKKCIFPTTETIYLKDIVIEQESNYKYNNNYNTTVTKFKKSYNDDYYNHYQNRYDNYEYYGEEEEEDTELLREKSESFTNKSKHLGDKLDKNEKFISKSKSPITLKKKSAINNSVSPTKKKTEFNSMIKEPKDSQQIKEAFENNLTPICQKKLFCIREKSRFDFVKDEKVTDIDDVNDLVPEHVREVICKKFSRHTFFKKFVSEFEKNNINDYIYFEKELKRNDSWSEFILGNLEKK
jgi:CCR4-NOT transcription complex subunit 4